MELRNSFIALTRIEEKASGVLIPLEVREGKPKMGKVIAFDEKLEGYKIGDTVLFVEYASLFVTIEGREIIFVKAEDVLAVIK